VWNLRVGGQLLRTTGEHPFWVENRGHWLMARELTVGDWLRTRDGSLVSVESVEDAGIIETVYNWRVADYHTYYVSGAEGGVSVWAHNVCTLEEAREIAAKHGGTEVEEGVFQFKTRRAARQAASEMAGDLGPEPTTIRMSEFRGGPKWGKKSNKVIGKKSADGSALWRDDFVGHPRYGDGPHVNVYGPGGVNFHLYY
jgi:hypothetical protein